MVQLKKADPILSSMGTRIKEARGKRGLAQREIARQLGVSAGAVAQWELGQSKPSSDRLAPLADILQISVDWMLGKPDAANRLSAESDQALLAEARSLGVDLKQVVAEARQRRWLEENRGAIEDANAFIERHGLWSDGMRRF